MNISILDICIGCGLCVNIVPEVFGMKDYRAFVLQAPVNASFAVATKEAIECCPVQAIQCSD